MEILLLWILWIETLQWIILVKIYNEIKKKLEQIEQTNKDILLLAYKIKKWNQQKTID